MTSQRNPVSGNPGNPYECRANVGVEVRSMIPDCAAERPVASTVPIEALQIAWPSVPVANTAPHTCVAY
jgi:hypothetical protein